MSGWLARHLQALFSSAGQLGRTPLTTALTVIVMALALALPQSLLTMVRNLRVATGDFNGAISITVYLNTDISESRAQQLVRSARSHVGVGQVQLISAMQSMDEFRRNSGLGAALDALPDNPLPQVLVVTPDARHSDRAAVESIRAYLVAWPEVDTVQLDSDWVERLNAILAALRAVLLVSAALLGAAVVAVVGNTIRLEIQNRRAEIEVTKLVGGTNAFVRRPFLYTGCLYGLLAGIAAWCVVAIEMWALRGPVQALAHSYGSDFVLAGITAREFGQLLAVGVMLGWMGALIASTRHLASIEPRN
jgi:cell division transport system permease protein